MTEGGGAKLLGLFAASLALFVIAAAAAGMSGVRLAWPWALIWPALASVPGVLLGLDHARRERRKEG